MVFENGFEMGYGVEERDVGMGDMGRVTFCRKEGSNSRLLKRETFEESIDCGMRERKSQCIKGSFFTHPIGNIL